MLATITAVANLVSEGSKTDYAEFGVDLWVWGVFLALVVGLLVADLLLVHRRHT